MLKLYMTVNNNKNKQIKYISDPIMNLFNDSD